jgi:uncharacterized damage-inducible protein DinB
MKPTLNAIKALPPDMSRLSYRCHEKTRSAAALLSHMLGHVEDMNNAVDTFFVDEKSAVREFESKEDAAAYFAKNATALAEKLTHIDDKTWDKQIIDFRHDGHSIFAYSMSNTFWLMLFDIIHHRGQLSTYYRDMGVRNPNIYGPTAEDVEARMALN